MDSSPEEARARAAAKLQKQQQAEHQAAEARAEHEAHAQAVEDKTARLKSLRLAKEAADKEAAAQAKAVAPNCRPAAGGLPLLGDRKGKHPS